MALRLVRTAAILAALLCVGAATAAAATRGGFRSGCGVEFSRGVAGVPGGPVCGTDEGDDAGFAGEDGAIAFFGENGHDTVAGSRYGDSFDGGGGNDEIHGGRGNDRIDGGDDVDTLFGGLGDDRIVERRFGVHERLFGGPGADVVAGGRGNDSLYGDTGNDVLLGGSGPDRLYGGQGDDVLYGGAGRDSFDCGPGRDTVYRRRSGAGRDNRIARSMGCERIVGTDPTHDFPLRDIRGTNRRDDVFGTSGTDLLRGLGGPDRLFGRGGDDELEGDGSTLQGADLLMGGSGNDRLAGRAGHDKLYGDARSETAGPPGNDELSGGAGRDLLVGGPGEDLLLGAYDGDRVLAGAGNDVINLLGGDTSDETARVFADCGRGRDVIVINPDRRGTFRNCETFADQFYTADFGFYSRPSPEVHPPGLNVGTARAAGATGARQRARRASPPGRRSQEAPAPLPADPDGGASAPSISADGSRVAFSSDASNLSGADSNAERTDAFVRDLPAAETLLAAATPRGSSPLRGARLRRGPSGGISADGRFAVFSSDSPDLAGRAGHYAIFRRDLARRINQRACAVGDEDSENPVISADGNRVVFESRATNLAGRDENQHTDVFWCDVFSGEVRRVSVPIADTVSGSGSSLDPSVSANGQFVAFTSDAGGIVPGDGSRAGVYWRDVQTGDTRLVDVPAGALSSNGSGQNPRISADGRFVVFDSDATDLPGGEMNGRVIDVFRKDVTDGSVVRVSQGASGDGANGDSTVDSLSADGETVVFSSNASNLIGGDGNGRADVFVRAIPTGITARASTRANGAEPGGPSSGGAISGDGRFVAFASGAPDVFPGLLPSARPRIFRKDLLTGAVEPVTVGIDLPPRSLLGEPSGTELRRKVRLVAGTARDDRAVAAVEVSVARRVGRRCFSLGRGKRLVKSPCDEPRYLRARVENGLRFTLRIGRLLPRGTYTIRSRAIDRTGQVETEREGSNAVKVTLR